MATISIFSIRLGRLLLTCQRDMANGYVLVSEGFRAPMSIDMAEELGGAAERIQRRAKRAVDGKMRPGPIFGIQLPDTKVTIGVVDSGLDVYCEAGDEHVRLSEDELEVLMFSLTRLRADVWSLRQSSGAEPYQLNMTEGQRGPGLELPDWADDTKWR